VPALDISSIKRDFPILSRKIRETNRLVYLDSGATSQKPNSVLDAERDFYVYHNAAVHRGAHQLAEEATELYEGARAKVAGFIGADVDEVIFTKSATESINAIAYSMGNAESNSRFHISKGDRIVVSEMEHHANLIPWQELAKRTGAELVWFKVTDDGRLDLSNIDELINKKTKIVALTHQSNVLGTINPLEKIVARTHEVGALFVLDAPKRFEAGVPNMAQAVGLGAAVDYLKGIGLSAIHEHEKTLTNAALKGLQTISGLKIIGPTDTNSRGGVVSFAIEGIHPHDLGQALDSYGIAVRTGHHCAWPLMKRFKTVATTRASFYLYNDLDDVNALVDGVERARKYFVER